MFLFSFQLSYLVRQYSNLWRDYTSLFCLKIARTLTSMVLSIIVWLCLVSRLSLSSPTFFWLACEM